MKYNRLPKLLFLLLMLCLLPVYGSGRRLSRFSVSFWGSFDTITTIVAYAEDEAVFQSATDPAIHRFSSLGQLYDRFCEYDGIHNLATVNRMAGIAPVKVPKPLFNLLEYALSWSDRSGGKVSAAFGPVTALWNQAIHEKAPPGRDSLSAASLLTDPHKVLLNDASKSVFLSESGMLLDVGAFAKGYAVELLGEELYQGGLDRMMISSGGNIRVYSPPPGQDSWQIGVQNPDKNPLDPIAAPLCVLPLRDCSLVTSGDYQRYFESGGRRYHHLIDPDTLEPAEYYRSVTVCCQSSADADALSTLLFLTPPDGIKEMAKRFGAEAVWVLHDGGLGATEGLSYLATPQ